MSREKSYHSCREKFNNPCHGTDEMFLSNCSKVPEKKEAYGSYSPQYKSLQQNNDKDETVYTIVNLNKILIKPYCNSNFNAPTGTQCSGGEIKQGARNRVVNPQFNGGNMIAYSGVNVNAY